MPLLLAVFAATPAMATKYSLADRLDSVVGELTTTYSEHEDTLLDIARENGLGYQDIKLVNPGVDTWLPGEGAKINLPLQFVLPDAPKNGIVLNIPEMRLYYYPGGKTESGLPEVHTYPLGVGREGWATPYLKTKIIEKKKNPKWYPPESIREEHEEAGDPLPKVVEAGPDNPLGDFAMRLGMPEYLIHGTNKPFGIGMRVSHGCIRLYPEDIEHLFSKVNVGTRVEIINQPYKVGEKNGVLYLEAHPHLEEDKEIYATLEPITDLINSYNKEELFEINWDMVSKTALNPAGVPVPVGMLKSEPAEPNLQVAEVIEDKVEIVDSDKTEITVAVPEPVNIVLPRQVPANQRSLKNRDEQLQLRMDTDIKP